MYIFLVFFLGKFTLSLLFSGNFSSCFFFIKHLDFFNEFWDSFSRLFDFFLLFIFFNFFINQESVIHPTPRLISFRLNLTQRLCTFLCFFCILVMCVQAPALPDGRTDRQQTHKRALKQVIQFSSVLKT